MPRESRRAEEILEVFTRQVADVGYDGTNFASIAAELGLSSKGTLVHHFPAKEQMLAALHASYMDRRLAELALIRTELAEPAARVAAVLHAFALYQVEDRAATVAVHREIVRLAGSEAMESGRAMRVEYEHLVRADVAAAVASGAFREVDPAMQTRLMFGSGQWLWTWYRPDGDRDAEDVGEALVDLVLGGLLADRGSLPELVDRRGRAAEVAREAIRRVAADYDVMTRISRGRKAG